MTQDGIWSLAWPTMAAMGAGTVVRFTDFAMVWSVLTLDYLPKTFLFVGRFRGGSWQRRQV